MVSYFSHGRLYIEKYTKVIGRYLYVCFCDFKKAFDQIWHADLLYKLLNYGIDGYILNIIKDMYQGSRFPSGLSNNIWLNNGVKQGYMCFESFPFQSIYK